MAYLQNIIQKDEASKKLKEGVDIVANIVGATLSPFGRNIVIGQGDNTPLTTKDGATVAHYINHSDRSINIGVQLIKSVARKTVRDSGDGTTSATIFAQHLIAKGLQAIENGANPAQVKSGIEKGVQAIVKELKKMSKDVAGNKQTLKDVATVASNGDAHLGEIIAEAYDKVGKEGAVKVKETVSDETTLETVTGTRFDKGYLAPAFINNINNMTAELEKPYILIIDMVLNSQKDIVSVMDMVSKFGDGRALVVIAENVMNEALMIMCSNNVSRLRGATLGNGARAGLQCVAIKTPWHGSRKELGFEDLALMTGATVISATKGYKISNIKMDHLGTCDKIICTADDTTIIRSELTERQAELVEMRAQYLREEIEKCEDDNKKNMLTDRLAKLVGGVAIISVGGYSELEVKERVDRIDDAIKATRSAMQEGVVAGGGYALMKCASLITECPSGDEEIGFKIALDTCNVQIRKMFENGALDIENMEHLAKECITRDNTIGYNARTQAFEDMFKAGIIDPTKVVRCALENAASVACMALLSGGILVDEIQY